MAKNETFAQTASNRASFPEVTWETINEPGTYVARDTGDLYRVPQEALIRGSSPIIRMESLGAQRLVHLSRNPYITTVEARMLAAECNVHPNF